MIDLCPKKVEIFNETFEDSVDHETSIFDSVDESQTLNSTNNDPVEEITTEGAVKMEIQEGSISKKTDRNLWQLKALTVEKIAFFSKLLRYK